MRIAVAADHAGRAEKDRVARRLRELGHEVEDFGTDSDESCDYPDFAEPAARAVSDGRCGLGVLVCGTGIGMSMAANKVAGIRAAACQSAEAARLSRAHNDANVLCVGSRLSDSATIREIVDAWLNTPFDGGRHQRRVNKIGSLEKDRTC